MDKKLLEELQPVLEDIARNSKTWEESLIDLFDGDLEKAKDFVKYFNENIEDFLL